MVARGALLAAAHQSGALDGVHDGDRTVALALLSGVASPAAVADDARPHVGANYRALLLAQAATDADLASPAWMRRVHEVACRPQLSHPVRGEAGIQDHVLAAGDFKHHPNHARTASGAWVAHAPLRLLGEEMGRLADTAGSPEFAALPRVARAAYVLHALTHVAPFADGNGRVARVLAGAHVLAATGVPLLVFADDATTYDNALAAVGAGDPAVLVAFVDRCSRDLVDRLDGLWATARSAPEQAAALDRWRRRAGAGSALAAMLPAAVERALGRHRRRSDLGWLSPLGDATVAADLVIDVPPTAVGEILVVDAHPLDDDGVLLLRATHAQLRLALHPEEVAAGGLEARLDPWLDRVVSVLALRVAAELE
jgi:hypothetical protein